MTVYLALGSNRGDRAAHLAAALSALAGAGVQVERVSAVRETAPEGATGRRWFLNGVVKGQTAQLPHVLLQRLRRIEQKEGRHRGGRTRKKMPRGLDLDLILYGRICIRSRELKVPHPHYASRYFVLAGLSELEPKLHAPGSAKDMRQISARRLGGRS